jgi:hypothetical protein
VQAYQFYGKIQKVARLRDLKTKEEIILSTCNNKISRPARQTKNIPRLAIANYYPLINIRTFFVYFLCSFVKFSSLSFLLYLYVFKFCWNEV